MEKAVYKTIDLFSGIGGIRRGFELTNRCQNVLSAEIDKYACQTYKHLFGDDSYNDVTTPEFKDLVRSNDYDILLAGFPCQAFSIAGQKKGFADKTRGTLFFDIADIINQTHPKAFLLENVAGLLSHNSGNTFKVIAETLMELGYRLVGIDKDNNGKLVYDSSNLVHSTKDYGLPQKRARIFILGFRNDLVPCDYVFPELPKKSDKIIYKNLYDLLETNVEPKYYLSQQLFDALKNHKDKHKAFKSGFGYIIVNQGDNPVSNTIMATGGSGKERNLICQHIDKYDGLVLGHKGPINKEGIRYMTPTEWGRLQGFIGYGFVDENGNDNFSFPDDISDTQRYKLFGNSVSIPVIECMANYLIERLDEFCGTK